MITSLLTVWLLYLAAMVSPGPNILLVSQIAASDMARSARFAGFGVATGAGIWATCAVLGVHAVFLAFPGLRAGLQVLGGAYLLYLASRLWRSNPGTTAQAPVAVSRLKAFRLGLLTNITNPKAALFFGSVFATSFPAHPDPALQVSAVVVVILSAAAWYALLAFLFSRARVQDAYVRASRSINRLVAVAFGSLGLGLIASVTREARAAVVAHDA